MKKYIYAGSVLVVIAISWSLKNKPFLKKVAEEWINKTLSEEYQAEHLVRDVGIYPVVTHINHRLTDVEKEKVGSTVSGSFNKTHILQHLYSPRDRNGLKLLWEEAMKGIAKERISQ